MISNQILQNTLEGLKAITRIDLCIMDTEGKVLASTFTDAEQYEQENYDVTYFKTCAVAVRD